MSNLKPCPFCGGDAEIERLGDRRQSTVYSCTQCGCMLETSEEFNHGSVWNTRPPTMIEKAAEEMAKALLSLRDAASDFSEAYDSQSGNHVNCECYKCNLRNSETAADTAVLHYEAAKEGK